MTVVYTTTLLKLHFVQLYNALVNNELLVIYTPSLTLMT